MSESQQHNLFVDEVIDESDLAFERRLWSAGKMVVAGVDEAGRGCLAGPVVAAAVVLPREFRIEGVTDSKTLSEKVREELAAEIMESADAWCVASCSPVEIDQLNILWASMEAMRRAVTGLDTDVEHVLIDGNTMIPRLEIEAQPLVKGDSLSHTIAAASILAKTHRDALMHELHAQHPEYGWKTNVGYPTVAHYTALRKHGPTAHHRKSFKLLK